MSAQLTCPVCGQRFEANTVDPASVPPMLADILGTTALGAAEGWNHQARARLEQELDRHLAAHTPEEWLPELMGARRQLDATQEALQEALRQNLALVDALVRADSLLSLVRYREGGGLSEQTRTDIDALIPVLRRLTPGGAR